MQLTQHTDYAVRTLLYVYAHHDRLVTISEISSFYVISRTHLAKVVANLTQMGYLQGVRGKKGGLRLAKAAQEINIGELIEKIEPLDLVECFGSANSCVITSGCSLSVALFQAKKAFLDVLKGYTLEDIKLKNVINNGAEVQINFLPKPA